MGRRLSLPVSAHNPSSSLPRSRAPPPAPPPPSLSPSLPSQVDPGPVAELLGDLTASLRLNASGFTLFLMNPKLPHPDFNYG